MSGPVVYMNVEDTLAITAAIIHLLEGRVDDAGRTIFNRFPNPNEAVWGLLAYCTAVTSTIALQISDDPVAFLRDYQQVVLSQANAPREED